VQITNPASFLPPPTSVKPSTKNRLLYVLRWLLLVHSDNPIRLVLNRGFAVVLTLIILLAACMLPVLIASREYPGAIVTAVGLPLHFFVWWLNRRGSVYGAGIYAIWLVIAIVLGSPPADYAGANTPIPLLIVFPVVTATLFVRPQAGIWALVVTMAAFGIQLAYSDVPRENALRFMTVATLDLAGITVFLVAGASMFWRSMAVSTAANEALRQQKEQFHYATLATQDAIYDWNIATDEVLRNEAYQKLYLSDEPLTADESWWRDHLHPDDQERVLESMNRVFRDKGRFWSSEYRFRRSDGEYADIIDRGYILYDPNGKPLRMIGALTDITDRKRAEAEKLELALTRERAQLLHELLNTLSHDLKTPLTIMNTSLYLLEKTPNPVHQKRKVDQIKEQVQLLQRMIEDILASSRLETIPKPDFQPVDLNQIATGVWEQFRTYAEERQITLNLSLAQEAGSFSGSEADLVRAVVNLVENALRYTPPQGNVSIHTFAERDQLAIEVRDTGIGIDQNDLAHIFDAFYRADKARSMDTGGTGLGLSIVKKIVEMHGGSIEVESETGKGSTFRVRLPVSMKPPA
jgi:PAS domain S-box-containing protein